MTAKFNENTATTIGAVLAIVASIFNAVGYTVQKKGHTRLKEFNKGKGDSEKKRLIKEKVWAIGFGIYLIGGLLNAVSLFYAPQSLVLPLSAITLVANTLLATQVLGEPFFRADIAGILFVIIGSVLAVMFGPRTAGGEATMNELKQRWGDGAYMTFFVVLSSCIGADYLLVRFFERKNARDESVTDQLEHAASFLLVSYCLLAGYFGSLAFLFLKSFTEFIGSSAGSSQIAADNAVNWYSYFTLIGVVITNFALEFFRQRGLSYFHAVYVVPINQVVLIVMGTVLGGLYFREFNSMRSVDAGMFVLAILMTVIGVFILAFNSGNVSEKTEAIINHTITLSLDPNPAAHPLPIPKIITTSPSMPITRPLAATIPDLPPPGMAGTIARIHGLQRSMATLQYTADGKPFYMDENFDTIHLQTLITTIGLDRLGDRLNLDPASLSKLNVFSSVGDRLNLNQQRLRRGISSPDVRTNLQHNPEGGGAELVSSHSERSLHSSALYHGDNETFRRRAPSGSHTGVQPDFITVRASSPSYTDKASTPNMNPVTQMAEITENSDGLEDTNGFSQHTNTNSNNTKHSSYSIQNGNHALEIEMTMEDELDAENDSVPSPIDRTNTDRHLQVDNLSEDERQQTV